MVSTELIKRFRDAFVPTHYGPFLMRRHTQKWFTQKRHNLTDGYIRGHLEGRYAVGAGGRHSRCLTFDIDAHDHEAERTLYDRAEKVMREVDEAQPIITTTPRGMHFRYLHNPAWKSVSEAWAKNRLREAGLKAGEVEVYDGGRVRLPLGLGSLMLDPYNFDPVAPTREGCIEALDDLLARRKTDLLDIKGVSIPAHDADIGSTRVGRSNGEFMSEIDHLLAEGLTGPGQRNDALLKLRWYYMAVEGYGAREAKRALWQWVSAKHNGVSTNYNKNPEEVRMHIDRVVASFDPDEISRKGNGALYRKARKVLVSTGLEGRELDIFAHMVARATIRGEESNGGLVTQIPSDTFREWYGRYCPVVRSLIEKGMVQRGRMYGVDIHRCNEYVISEFYTLQLTPSHPENHPPIKKQSIQCRTFKNEAISGN